MQKLFFKALLLFTVTAGIAPLLQAAEYIQITREKANIRSSASTNSTVVGSAIRGDIFVLEAEEKSWYKIHMFSGESRYIYKNLAEIVLFKPSLPEDEAVARTIYSRAFEMDRKADDEAEARYPAEKRPDRNRSYRELLKDRYLLEMMHEFLVPPASYRRILIEGNFKGWPKP